MAITDIFRGWLWNFLMPGEVFDESWRERIERYSRYKEYYDGQHKRQLKHKPMQADDNLVENYTSLIVERSISMLLGDGLQFELEDDNAQALIDEIATANHFKVLLHDAAQNASIYGTGFFKLILGGVESRQRENKFLTRIVVLDPRWMKIVTPPEDIDRVIGYEMRFNIGDTARKEVIEIFRQDEMTGEILSWLVSNYEANRTTGGRWNLINEVEWPYEFPPIVHWKNLPQANDCYGQSDLEDALELQDRINFVSSNISKIIRYHGHPKTWGRGAGLGNKVNWGADEVVLLNGQDAHLANLEMQSDLASSREYRNDLKAALFDITRTVDLSAMKDKIGQLTNFGLRVLYNDALDKLSTKRDLFGEALIEAIHRILILEGEDNTNPGIIVWPEPLPIDKTERDQSDGFDLDRGLVSKETIATRRGYDWNKELERIEAERASEDNIGSALLRAFNRGA